MKLSAGQLFLFFVLLTGSVNAQVALNGTVEIFPYSGLQPDLVKGVSLGHATEQPLLRHVCLVDKNIVALTIDEKAVILRSIIPYKKQTGDTIIFGDYHNQSKILVRNGSRAGYICGINNAWFRPDNQLSGEELDLQWVKNPDNFAVVSENDDRFFQKTNPVQVHRKTYPHRRTHISQKEEFALRHEIYLVFENDFKPGETYTVHFGGNSPFSENATFRFDDFRLRSEAVQVNLSGYHPNQPKLGFLSIWLGDGSSHTFEQDLVFHVVDIISGQKVFSGKPKLKPEIGHVEDGVNKSHVYELDFTELNSPGQFRLVVPGIGCSFNFEIDGGTWEKLFRLTMKGFLHQRSGIELGPPYTDYLRPRNMHPEDGVTIHKCDVKRFFGDESEVGQQGVFERIQSSILPETDVPEAWGGWMDAGDFDQRMGHLYSVRRMMYLCEINPGYFSKTKLNIPESETPVPDILEEARWCLDLYRRTQHVYEEGAVSWWVESIAHPRGGEPSWLNSLPTALIPPTPRANYQYAAAAAHMSHLIKNFDKSVAEDYLKSALAAVEWADKNPKAPDPFGRNPRAVTEALAFINLYKATGDNAWHDRYLKNLQSIFPNGFINGISTGNVETLAAYLLLEKSKADTELYKKAEEAIIHLANELLAGAAENNYFIFNKPGELLKRLVLPARSILPVVLAHNITKEKIFADALSKTIQYTLGANPMNRSYISGLGERWFIPYQLDFESANMPAPSGIPNFGPAVQTKNTWGWSGAWAIEMVQDAGLHPGNLLDWPFAEKCFNNLWIAPVNEFTVRHPLGELVLLSGYLAQEFD